MKKSAVIIIVSILSFMNVNAQTGGDYAAQWKKVQDFENKGLTKSALDEVIKIFNDALSTDNETQQIKAAMFQMKYRNMTEENNAQKNIFFIDTLINKTKVPAKNILQSMQAQMFQSYRDQNRYKFYNRTAIVQETGNDIDTWSIAKLNEKISSLYRLSLSNAPILKSTNLKGFDPVINKGVNTENLRPTLYDFLAHRGLDFFMNSQNDVTQAAYKFIINEEVAFAPVQQFSKHRFVTKDTSSLYFNAVLVLQDLLAFHLNDAKPDALIDADLRRLAFVNDHGVFTNKNKLYEAALTEIETKYSSNPASAQASYLKALLYQVKGNTYDPFSNKTVQFDLVKAKQICEAAYAKFPKSEGGINCKNLINQIEQPSLNFQTEKVNLPAQPFRSLISYKNIPKLYFRIVKTNNEEIKRIQQSSDYEKIWPQILALKPMRTWSATLPDQIDLQQHSTEIKIDQLTMGTYYLIASIDPDFSLSQNIVARSLTYISNIGYIVNTKNELYVLNRDNGQPVNNASIQLWKSTYSSAARKYEDVKAGAYTTDKNGFAKIERSKNYENYFIQIKAAGDELFTDDGVNSYYYDGYNTNRRSAKRTFLFTDRSIYRPGQTVFFKGIMTSTDSTGTKSGILVTQKSTVQLFDKNNQKVKSINVTTNEYGSYNGSFVLPEALLNGNFYIKDTVTSSTQYFSVEEYKRPKFYTEIKKPEGSYRVNDSIKVTGSAKAYAGNNIDGAKVSYRVVRVVRYPIWYSYYRSIYPPRGSAEIEITNGVTVTDTKGEFNITFKAIPDETVEKSSQPVFEYRVTADITDLNGETRSGNTLIAVSYNALQLDITGPAKMSADSLKNIGVRSTNANGLHEKATVNFVMYKLQEPQRIFRARYWQMPDVFIINKEEYYRSFPYDAYADEDQIVKWALGQKVADISDTTAVNSKFQIPNAGLVSGWYKIIVTTKDKYGEDVRAEKFVQLTDNSSEKIQEPIRFIKSKESAEPGEKLNYNIATGFDKIWLIQNVIRPDENYKITYPTVSAGESLSNTIDVSEKDRGGISVSYAFVQHNRTYTGTEIFSIPWSNKQLQVSYETFRDKLLPGAEEKWKIKITGDKAEKVAAETLISMYDASLDQFKPQSWASLNSLWPGLNSGITWTVNNFGVVNSEESNRVSRPYIQVPEKVYAFLVDNGWNGFYPIFRMSSGARMEVAMAAPMLENDKLASVGYDAAEVNQSVATARRSKSSGRDFDRERTNQTGNTDTFKLQDKPEADIQIRKNFNETAFFFPDLRTDEQGNVEFSFTIPEALTKWKLMIMAHTKELASAYSENTTITQKELMVQPNAPRFLREGDRMEFSAKIVNLSANEITGTSQLELFDAATNKSIDGWFKNVFPNQYFTVPAGQSIAVKFPVDIPFNSNSALTYRIKAAAKDNSFSDGEEDVIPVLTNRTLVTETLPLNMRNTNSKTFKFDKLLNSSNSGSLTNHALTIEYTSNPAWYAVQALPYLMEYPYECAEQSFNRYYANALASFISNATPKIKAVFDKWALAPSLSERAGGEVDTTALMSNLQKNQELKAVLLEETPWVLNAQSESQQKKNIGLLFDMLRLAGEKNKTLAKLKEMQSSNGGFTWFKGGPDDRYMTQYIITGIGHLRKLGAASGDDYASLKTVVDKALPYLDARIKEDYDNLIRYKADLSKNNLSSYAIQYLYMRSFFPETGIAGASQKAVDYYKNQSVKYWLSQGKYMQATIALALHRNGDTKTPKAIIESLRQNSITSEEMGMYWKDFMKGGYYWYQAPIESQAMMIEAFTDIDKNVAVIDDLKTWLLKQKQTQQWPTTKATAEACYALLLNGSNWLSEEKVVTINVGNAVIKSADEKIEAGTGYFKKRIEGDKVQQGMGNITVSIAPVANQPVNQSTTSWGAAYWQYFEDLDKITASETPLKLMKKLFIERNSDKGPVLEAVKDGDELKVGDKIKVRIELRSDRDMEYVHMKDMRAACMEPVNVISQYKWQGGLGYYESTKDASTNFFFSWLPKGTYVFEYPMFVTHAGNFSNGITSIQCMYAPEFTAHSEGVRVSVE